MAEDGDGENGGALLSDPVDVVIDKLLRYVRGRTGFFFGYLSVGERSVRYPAVVTWLANLYQRELLLIYPAHACCEKVSVE